MRRLSQLRAGYRRSPISMDALPGSGGVRAGDRLPDATVTGPAGRCRLHELLAAPGVHVLLDEATEAGVEPLGPFVRQHRVSLGPGPTAVAIRPDGHVGFRGGPAGIADWLDLVHAAAGPRASAGTAHQVTAQ